MKSVPESVVLAKQEIATNRVPVCLGIGSAWDGEVLGWTADWPAGLGDPDRLALSSVGGVAESLLEERGALVDTVDLSVLEVWVGVNTDPVDGGDDVAVGSVDPSSPGVNVANRGSGESGTRDGAANLLDVVDEGRWLLAWVGAAGLDSRW